jgi:hypothetical protein
MAKSSDKNGQDISALGSGRLSGLYDLYIDLLGSLVPGLLTVILGSMAIYLALSAWHFALFKLPLLPKEVTSGAGDVLGAFHWEFATIIIVSSYVIGAVFFRQDPKKPDSASALHIWMNSREKERSGLAVQAKEPLGKAFILSENNAKLPYKQRLLADICPKTYIKKLKLDTQFPYLHLRCYLAARGLTHLIRLVPWCPDKKNTNNFRTKMFINILKIRLLSNFPHISRDIIRNEAHVRLATSVWYASSVLACLALMVLMLLVIITVFCGYAGMGSTLFGSVAFALLLLLFCLAMRHHLRRCIHYMRVREVIYVLETAHLAEQSDSKLLADLIEKEKTNECMHCGKIKSSNKIAGT